MTPAGALVLLYHRVDHLERDPFGIAVRPDRFAQQCEILRKRCHVVPLRELQHNLRQVVITFDDGYADNASVAKSILAGAGLPATFFVTAGRLGERAEAWWDRLEQILLECETVAGSIDVEIGGRRLWADIRSPKARERVHLALYWRLRPLRPAAIASVLDGIEGQLGVRSTDRETHRWMSVEELRALSSTEGMDIGAHTLTHPFLRTLSPEEQWEEINGSRRALEGLLGMPVTLFSYPYGGYDTFDSITTQMVRDAGYTMACTVTGGLVKVGCDPFHIPRNVVGDWNADTFERWLDQWLPHRHVAGM